METEKFSCAVHSVHDFFFTILVVKSLLHDEKYGSATHSIIVMLCHEITRCCSDRCALYQVLCTYAVHQVCGVSHAVHHTRRHRAPEGRMHSLL